jgi:putative oxidoreductase
MSETLRGVLTVAGRLLLSAIFLMAALANKIPHYEQTLKYMEMHRVPAPRVLRPGAIAFLLVGGFSVLLGYRARFGAALLAVFLVLATFYFHDFWNLSDEGAKQNQMAHFLKNAGLLGAMLFLVGNGSGPWSLDRRLGARRGPA